MLFNNSFQNHMFVYVTCHMIINLLLNEIIKLFQYLNCKFIIHDEHYAQENGPSILNENESLNYENSSGGNIIKTINDNHPDLIIQLNRIVMKKSKILHRLRNVPIEYEDRLELFCKRKRELAHKNIIDWNFEKSLSYDINDPYIYIVRNSFTNKECDEMIHKFEKETYIHYNGVTGGGYTPNTKRTTEINITRSQSWSKWNNICFERLNHALKKYAQHCINKCHNNTLHNILHGNGRINDTGYQLQKYMKEQQYYKWHQDGGLKQGHHEHRIITYLWYLNDVNEGGETYFFNGKVKPKKGSLVLFPATWNYNHKGETPISDDKYIITGWVYSDV
jgi:hypothetical protein